MQTTQSMKHALLRATLLGTLLLSLPAQAGRFIPSSCTECAGKVTWVVFLEKSAGDTEKLAFSLRDQYGGRVRAVWPDGKFAIEATRDEVRAMLADQRVTLIDGRTGRYFRSRGARATAELGASPEAGSNVWSTGPYQYDGAGNILRIGPNAPWNQTDVFHYDRVGRLVSAQVSAANSSAPENSAVQWSESYEYDAFGNMLSRVTTKGIGATPEATTSSVNPSTNRLSGTNDPDGTRYDKGGNWLGVAGVTQTFDAMNRMTSRSVIGAGEEYYIYAAGGERVATYRTGNLTTLYTLRGPDQKVVREFEKSATGELTWKKDYIWRGGSLLASITSDASTTHYHLDHLGTPRLLTDGSGNQITMNAYLPFGGEIPDGEPDLERHKFTGHERDNLGNGNNPLDYMHARYYNPNLGRFLSVDPGNDWDLKQPQSWNLYSYTRNNPISNTDPNGKYCIPCIPWIAKGLVAGFALAAGTETYLQMPSVAVPGKTNGEVLSDDIASIPGRLRTTLTTLSQTPIAAGSNDLGPMGPITLDGFGRTAIDTMPIQSSGTDRQKGERAKAGTAAEADQQLEEIEQQQNRTRTGKSDGIIENIDKSKQRSDQKRRRIRDLKDAEDEYGD